MPKFKKGDKVVFVDPELHEKFPVWYPSVGTVGVVVKVDGDDSVRVKWRKGTTSSHDTWFAPFEAVAPARPEHEKQKIIIMVDKDDPRKVVAKDLVTGEVGIAMCSTDDLFDFYTGAQLAFERLAGGADHEPLHKCKFKVGDVIIGNKKADKYNVTKRGWVGMVTHVFDKPCSGRGCDDGVDIWFLAKGVKADMKYAAGFGLDQDAFDLA